MGMTITLIAAMAHNRVIGIKNRMPWSLPSEMAHFIRSTRGKTVLMGRKTFESLGGKPLKDRRNVILTRSSDFAPEGCEIVRSVEEALRRYGSGSGELMIAGGAAIYEQFLPFADKLLLTEVDATVEGDAFFPEFADEDWELSASEAHRRDERNAYDYCIRIYLRKPLSD